MIETDARRRSRRPWIIAASAWIACLGGLAAWTLWTPVAVLRDQLSRLQFWSLEICVLLGLVLSGIVLLDMRRLVERRDLVGMMLPLIVGLGLLATLVPRTGRIFYDEQIYQNIGQNLADLRRAQMCNDGAIEAGRLRCSIAEYNKQPYAFPHLLSVVYRAVGVGQAPAFAVNAGALALSLCFVYLIALLLFSDRTAAFFAALLLALTPQQLIWSASGAVEPSASAACLAALLATACFVRLRSTSSLAAVAVASAYAIQFRPESLLIVPAIALLLWQRAREEFWRPRLWWAALLFLVLASVHLAHMAAVRNEGWGTNQARMSLAYVAGNLRSNGWFYVADSRFPALYTALAALGLSHPRSEGGRLALTYYFCSFFTVALLFYAGSYDYGQDIRYSLATYPPLAILAGFGLARLAGWLERIGWPRIALPALTLALLAQFMWYAPQIRSTTDGAWASRADVAFARSLVSELPPNAYVLTQNPGMFQVWGVSAGQTSLAVNDPPRLDSLARRYPGGVYLHWNFWCNVQDPVQRGFCTKILELRVGEMVREQRVQDQRFALYHLREAPQNPAKVAAEP